MGSSKRIALKKIILRSEGKMIMTAKIKLGELVLTFNCCKSATLDFIHINILHLILFHHPQINTIKVREFSISIRYN